MIPELNNVFLLTDFGTSDHYVAVMKAVILARSGGVRFIDITHDVAAQNVEQGCYILESSWSFLPMGSVVLAVVDPGVGTEREAAVFHHEGKTIIGPNNGLLGFLPKEVEGRVLDRPEFWLKDVSPTFHGRDIFAPCAAHIAASGHWLQLGERKTFPVSLESDNYVKIEGAQVVGRIIYFDRFGNAVSTIRSEYLKTGLDVEVPGKMRCAVVNSFGNVNDGAALGYMGSTKRLELAVRNGNARNELGLALNDKVILHRGIDQQ